MANRDHLRVVKRGAAAINQWRRQHPDERLELSGANLSRAHLRGANLNVADLSTADLHGADLSGAALNRADLSEADLRRVVLDQARLVRAILRDADLSGANLTRALLDGADFIYAHLCGGNLSEVTLSWANLSGADLSGVCLTGSDLTVASFSFSNLTGANLTAALCASTCFADCDLSRVQGLETVQHDMPSTIGVDTLVLTLKGAGGQFTAAQRTFFENAGVPRTLLDYLPDLLETEPIQFFSCFISYGGEDGEFAQRLYDDLRSRDIRCWKYDVDAIVGREVWGNISRAIVLHEKMIVICSQSSLERPGVLGEIERALQKEEQLKRQQAEKGNADMDTDVLVPVRLDDYVLDAWDYPRAADVKKKHIGDFREWQDATKYEEAFEQLLRALDPRSKLGIPKGDLRGLTQD